MKEHAGIPRRPGGARRRSQEEEPGRAMRRSQEEESKQQKFPKVPAAPFSHPIHQAVLILKPDCRALEALSALKPREAHSLSWLPSGSSWLPSDSGSS